MEEVMQTNRARLRGPRDPPAHPASRWLTVTHVSFAPCPATLDSGVGVGLMGFDRYRAPPCQHRQPHLVNTASST